MADDLKLDLAQLHRLLTDQSNVVARDMFRRGRRVEAAAKRNVRVDTGRLRSSITTEMVTRNGAPVARVGTNVEYARFVHDGTGIYGPRRRPIRPVRAKILVFTPRGSARPVFTKEVRGSRPNPFLKDALREAVS